MNYKDKLKEFEGCSYYEIYYTIKKRNPNVLEVDIMTCSQWVHEGLNKK